MERQLVKILKSMVPDQHRDFIVQFDGASPKSHVASYRRTGDTKIITLQTGHFDNPFDMLGAGIHEVAHHLAYNSGVKERARHGIIFRQYLDWLIRRFNAANGRDGRFIWNRRKPTRSPRFVRI